MSKKGKIIGAIVIGVALVATLVIRGNNNSAVAEERLQLEITSPAGRDAVTDEELVVTGIVSNSAARLTVNDEVVSVDEEGGFSHPIMLEYGDNRIRVQADGEEFRAVQRTLRIPRRMVLTVSAPELDSTVGTNVINFVGTVSDLSATVMVAGRPVEIAEDGSWSTELNLHYPLTVINVTASREGIDPITQLVTVNFDPDHVSLR
ncbi:MAG: hypothetical protein ACOCYB_04590 [Alkalispirochaeta sp.]